MTSLAFLVDTMEESVEKTNREIILEKYKNLKVAPELKRLRGCIKLTEDDLKDERIQYILGCWAKDQSKGL